MFALLHTEFAALLARADVSQAGFARLAGVTARQVNNWARGRAAVPLWAAALAAILEEHSADGIEMLVEDAAFRWHEVLGLSLNSDAPAVRQAMTRLALLYHPDKGGQPEQMTRINAAYEQARSSLEKHPPDRKPPPRS